MAPLQHETEVPFALVSESEGGGDIFVFKAGSVFAAFDSGEVCENVFHPEPHATDAGLAASLAGLDGDYASLVHGNEHAQSTETGTDSSFVASLNKDYIQTRIGDQTVLYTHDGLASENAG